MLIAIVGPVASQVYICAPLGCNYPKKRGKLSINHWIKQSSELTKDCISVESHQLQEPDFSEDRDISRVVISIM